MHNLLLIISQGSSSLSTPGNSPLNQTWEDWSFTLVASPPPTDQWGCRRGLKTGGPNSPGTSAPLMISVKPRGTGKIFLTEACLTDSRDLLNDDSVSKIILFLGGGHTRASCLLAGFTLYSLVRLHNFFNIVLLYFIKRFT
jgi:hypothetical protein